MHIFAQLQNEAAILRQLQEMCTQTTLLGGAAYDDGQIKEDPRTTQIQPPMHANVSGSTQWLCRRPVPGGVRLQPDELQAQLRQVQVQQLAQQQPTYCTKQIPN